MLLCFVLFLAAVVATLALDVTLTWAVLLGLALFTVYGRRKGVPWKDMWDAAWAQGKKMCAVLIIYGLIGCITGLWRSGGTIAFFIYYGTRLMTPRLFLLVAFLLTCLISYALGTSFGVVGTAGVILMALGRSGGVDPAVTAGAVLAGAYFGDRCSPASSSATLVAAATDTKLMDNLVMMRRTGWLPLFVSTAVYAVLSCTHPLQAVDDTLLRALADTFRLSPLTVIPALVIVALPLCKVSIRTSMAVSAACALAVTLFFQNMDLLTALKTALLGYRGAGPLGDILSGGGVLSMVECSVLAIGTGMYAGLLDRLGALDGLRGAAERLAEKAGLFAACTAAYTVTSCVFCNQSTGAVLVPQLLGKTYHEKGADDGELAIDMENSGVVIAPLIPWNISVSIPLVMLGATARAIPYAVLLYMIPLCYGLTKTHFYPRKEVHTS